jgi:type IV pilus assembly protein PilY1
MNKIASTLFRYASATSLTVLVFGPAANPALAAPGILSQIPLYVGSNVEPNVVFINDDSGSMGYTVMAPEEQGYVFVNKGESGREFSYRFTHWRNTTTATNDQRYTDNSRQLVVPTEKGIASVTDEDTARRSGVWRTWNHNYNKLYYNPGFRYTPWVGMDKNGNAFSNVDPAKALVNPYDPDLGYEDLTSDAVYGTRYKRPLSYSPSTNSTININNITMFPAHYYVWEDVNADDPTLSGNGVIDATDNRTLVEIKPATPIYPKAAGRSDCIANVGGCTYAEEIQNFANWFSYYRSRDYTAKNAATAAIAEVTGIRVGYATINEDSGVRNRVASMNLDPTTGNKRTLFNRIYDSGYQFTTSYGKGTPLRTALNKTGRYYACQSSNIMGTSANSNCPILPAGQGGMCQKNYAILMTDGFWNDSSPPSPGNTDGDGNTTWDGPPYADGHSNTLADVAMHYYERDLNTSLSNDVPFKTGDKDNAPHQHMTTYTVAFGVSGTLNPEVDDPTAPGFSWPSPFDGDLEKIDDLWHAAYNGRGEFFNAQDPIALQEGLRKAFASVSRGKSSSASVAFNTAQLGVNNVLFQASFNPSDNWAGSLAAIELSNEGHLGSTIWNASTRLDAKDPDSRLILTYNEDTGNGTSFRTLSSLSASQQNDLNTAPDGSKDGLGQARIDFLRGDRDNEGPGNGHEFRQRSSVLGDIVYSNPVFVGSPKAGYNEDADYTTFMETNITRPAVIYVGANDGMLHGFYASNGEPAISYVPGLLSSETSDDGLHYLSNPIYQHRYYNDLSPTVADARIGGSWRTVLVGGFRAGGRGLFALDVTLPQNFSEAGANNTVLWEFTHADMGNSFSKPTIAQLEDDSWAAVFGNGYNSTSGRAKLFIVNVSNGSVIRVIDTAAGTHGLSTPALVDSDGNGKADRVYAGDLAGNLWVFDLSAASSGSWNVAYQAGAVNAPLFTANVSGVAQPITSKPILARNPAVHTTTGNQPNILVLFGTGQYIVDGDKNNPAVQSFYGVWDSGSSQLLRGNLVAQTVTGNSTGDLRHTTDHVVNYGSEFGWYLDLPVSGERVIVDPRIRGEYVFFNTLIPDVDTCNSSGSGWLMALKIGNGGNPNSPVYDVNNDDKVDDGDLIDGSHVPSGIRMENIPAGSNFIDDLMFTPDDEGEIFRTRVDDGSGAPGRISWREIRS